MIVTNIAQLSMPVLGIPGETDAYDSTDEFQDACEDVDDVHVKYSALITGKETDCVNANDYVREMRDKAKKRQSTVRRVNRAYDIKPEASPTLANYIKALETLMKGPVKDKKEFVEKDLHEKMALDLLDEEQIEGLTMQYVNSNRITVV